MSVVYRLVRSKYKSQPFSTFGSRLYGGRWNPKGTGILYTASTPELALLEMLAHAPGVRYEDLPDFWLLSFRLPEAPHYYHREEMPDFWQEPVYERTQYWLRDWLTFPDKLGIGVPSVLVPLSHNILLNPVHPAFQKIELTSEEALSIDRRLWHG